MGWRRSLSIFYLLGYIVGFGGFHISGFDWFFRCCCCCFFQTLVETNSDGCKFRVWSFVSFGFESAHHQKELFNLPIDLSIQGRRLYWWWMHALFGRARQVCARSRRPPPPPPGCSALISCRLMKLGGEISAPHSAAGVNGGSSGRRLMWKCGLGKSAWEQRGVSSTQLSALRHRIHRGAVFIKRLRYK